MTNFPDIPEEKHSSPISLVKHCDIDIPVTKNQLKKLIKIIEQHENVSFNHVELVYFDEKDMVELNKKHFNRDYVTDIISFRYDEDESNRAIEGTLFCCAPRITEQSTEFSVNEAEEYLRIFIHGILHLTGYNDQTESEKLNMTNLENKYLKQYQSE